MFNWRSHTLEVDMEKVENNLNNLNLEMLGKMPKPPDLGFCVQEFWRKTLGHFGQSQVLQVTQLIQAKNHLHETPVKKKC